MKLSEAIRLGAMLRPQSFGWQEAVSSGSCALMAANEAIGNAMSDFFGVVNAFPMLNEKRECPTCGEHHELHWIIAMHLNDKYRWTREQIADLVATIEAQAASTVPPMGESERSSPVSAGSASGVA